MITGEDVLYIKYSNYGNIGKHEKKMKRFLHLFENRKENVLKLFFFFKIFG